MDISPVIGDLAMGGFAGYSVGYFAKKFMKLVAFIIGGYIASLIYLSSRGIVTVNWSAIGTETDGIITWFSDVSLSVGLLGIGSIAGFALGWKSG